VGLGESGNDVSEEFEEGCGRLGGLFLEGDMND